MAKDEFLKSKGFLKAYIDLETGCPRYTRMSFQSRICLTSRGTSIDAIGMGRYRVCFRDIGCSEVTGLHQAYQLVTKGEATIK